MKRVLSLICALSLLAACTTVSPIATDEVGSYLNSEVIITTAEGQTQTTLKEIRDDVLIDADGAEYAIADVQKIEVVETSYSRTAGVVAGSVILGLLIILGIVADDVEDDPLGNGS